jgi:geranylgeranyl pyrophosphate synthase
VLEEKIISPLLHEAIVYFAKHAWYDPAHPTLLSLACEAVGTDPEIITDVAAAFTVLTGAADIHDDIIDQSRNKENKLTVYGKYGKDISLIAGDILWIKGMLMLSEACERFGPEKKRAILQLTKQALLDIGSAETREAEGRGNFDLKPEEFLKIIELKVSLATAAAQIGAIIGNGTPQQIEKLGQYGKTLGVLTTMREEFINMFEAEELTNRFKNECLPLPILSAFQNPTLKRKILTLLNKGDIVETNLDKILEEVYEQPEVRELGQYMYAAVNETIKNLSCLTETKEDLVKLLKFTLQDLPY